MYNTHEKITIDDVKNALTHTGITFTQDEVQDLFNSLKWEDNFGDTVSRLEVYANGHLFKIDEPLRGLKERIAFGSGSGLSEADLMHLP